MLECAVALPVLLLVLFALLDLGLAAMQYNTLADQYKSIPFAKSQNLDIDHYVVTKALDGLFYELADQEKQIRKNPAARTTTLLKEVFANARK